MLEKKCIFCGKLFSKPKTCSIKEFKLRKFCSKECVCKFRLGKTFSTETKKKQSISLKKAWNDGRMSGFTGKKCSNEKKISSSLVMKDNWKNGKIKPKKPWNIGTKGIVKAWNKGLKGYNSGEKNNMWKGGISKYPYPTDWTETLRRSIRERDNYVCQICSKQQGDKAHQVHHIDYDKNNCNPDNLITLCVSCHAKTNSNREYWIEYFLNKNYGSNNIKI